MVKANIETASGAKIMIEGPSSEVSEIIEDFRDRDERKKRRIQFREKMIERRKRFKEGKKGSVNGDVSVTSILINFVKEGFFNEPKKFRDVANRLEKAGIFIPSSTLHPLLFRLVAHGKLKRKRGDDDFWEYVKNG